MKRRIIVWLHGLFGGAIGGGATAATSTLGCQAASNLGSIGIVIDPLKPNQIFTIFISAAVFSAFLYLKKSPLPPLSAEAILADETKTETK